MTTISEQKDFVRSKTVKCEGCGRFGTTNHLFACYACMMNQAYPRTKGRELSYDEERELELMGEGPLAEQALWDEKLAQDRRDRVGINLEVKK